MQTIKLQVERNSSCTKEIDIENRPIEILSVHFAEKEVKNKIVEKSINKINNNKYQVSLQSTCYICIH